MDIETKRYSDGMSATGPGPLPDLSPDQQAAFVTTLTQDDAIRAYGYLVRLFEVCAPQCAPLPDLIGVCTQIDNLIAGYRTRLGEIPDPALIDPEPAGRCGFTGEVCPPECTTEWQPCASARRYP